jgi:hypothetical protein
VKAVAHFSTASVLNRRLASGRIDAKHGSFLREGLHTDKSERAAMSDDQETNEERPCLHCLIVELIDNFFAEYPAAGEPDTVDTDEVIIAVAKTVAELTSSQDGAARKNMIEQLMGEIMNYDAEFRQQEAMGAPGSHARH